MQDAVLGDPLKPLTALGVARSGTIGYTAISQIMMFNSVPSWFDAVSKGNQDLQEDVEMAYSNTCWTAQCLKDPRECILEKHIEDNWQRFFSSTIMAIPLEGH